ncbi:T9SS type A sorting domain-containing protein [Rhodocytophaga rosea]|uniref:T9SS type A sorting domain-containing protein n=1 Tax=Rhodocytophaga rosea TaxID=2704465 RepID=A0A6C0GDN7_9BACT|nr:T9SS type A sorting domain-containing protein [Rhodocytophaga rosea]QHT65790.1 T9SS type A sorting domain-containing protein [Rhodocytophaga rosea]
MTKILLYIIVFVCLVPLARGQTVSGSGGRNSTNSTLNLSWPIDQPAAIRGSSPHLIINSGYQQSNLLVLPMARESAGKLADIELSVFPNPTQDVLHIAADPSERYTATIRTMKGELVNAFSIMGETEIDVRELTTGSYILAIISHDKKVNKNFRINKIK